MVGRITFPYAQENTIKNNNEVFQSIPSLGKPLPINQVNSGVVVGLLGKELNKLLLSPLQDYLTYTEINQDFVTPGHFEIINNKFKEILAYQNGLFKEYQRLSQSLPDGLVPELDKRLHALTDRFSKLQSVWENLDQVQRVSALSSLKEMTQEYVNVLNSSSKPTQNQVKLEDMFTGVPSK